MVCGAASRAALWFLFSTRVSPSLFREPFLVVAGIVVETLVFRAWRNSPPPTEDDDGPSVS